MKNGFTLIELAIVIVIIGLLVAGVLQGKALIRTSELNSIVSEIKAIESGIYLYRDKYNALPGDDMQALTKFPNCTSLGSCINGNGDGSINSVGGTETPFMHMISANTLRANQCKITYAAVADRYASIVKGNCYVMGFSPNSIYWGAPLNSILFLPFSNGASLFTPEDMQYMDMKIDDGSPSGGRAISIGRGASPSCLDINTYSTSPAGSANYNLSSSINDCIFYYKLIF